MDITEDRFLKDVAEHHMITIRDEGVHRHIRFKAPGTMMKHFDLITWPGYLCYTGDMGTFVFSRINDMFEFFRMGKDDWNYNRDGGLSINPGYWSEKLQGIDKNGGYECFDENKFIKIVSEYRLNWVRENNLNKDERRELWDAVTDEVLNATEDGEHRAFDAAYSFSHRIGNKKFQFDDFFEYNFTKHTYRFIWCCYALAWGINLYTHTKQLAKPIQLLITE